MIEDIVTEKDIPNVRTITKGTATFTLERRDPYGLWFIKWDQKNKLPLTLQGAFTGPELAAEAVNQYKA